VNVCLSNGTWDCRRAAAAVELAICLPVLFFFFVIAFDWARVYYYSETIENCARQGALWASDPVAAIQSPYTTVSQAALADAGNLSPQPNVSSAAGASDANGNATIAVTVTWSFPLVTNYPGIGNSVNLSRTVTMTVAP
jgi:Flp pilus assembly protein TadG